MALTYTGTGGLFTRLGRIGGAINNVLGFIGDTAPDTTAYWGSSGPPIAALKANIDNIEAQFASANQQLVDSLYATRDSYRTAHSTYLAAMQTLAAAVVRKQVGDEVTLTSDTIAVALANLITAMKADAYYVALPTVAVTSVTAGSANNGTGVVRASVVNPYGVNIAGTYAETIDVTCTYDSQQSSGVLSHETFSWTGDAAVSGTMSYGWPAGSGSTGTLYARDADSASYNLLTNGDFEDFTGNAPDSWTIVAGAAGTEIFAETGEVYGPGIKSLKFYDNSADAQIYQALTTLEPNTVYCVNVWVQKTAGLVAGAITIDLHNGSAVIADDASTNNSLTIAYNTSGVSDSAFSSHYAFFRTPRVMPSTVRLRVRVSTTFTNNEGMYIDRLCLAAASQAYTNGPYLACFSGETKFVRGDTFAVLLANNWTSHAGGPWHKLFERLFGMRALGLQLPSSGSTAISASLIA